MVLASPLILIKILEFLQLVSILLFPIALVTSITVTDIVLYIGISAFLLLLILRYFLKIKTYDFSGHKYIHFSFLIYIVAFTISTLVNSGFDPALNILQSGLKNYFVFLWVLIFVSNDLKKQEKLRKAILLAAVLSIVYGLMQIFHLDIFSRQENVNRLTGFHCNPYTYGGQLIVFFFLLLNEARNKWKSIFYVLLLLCLICALNTSERAIIFALGGGLIVYFILVWRKNFNKKDLLPLFLLISVPLLITKYINDRVIKRVKGVILPKAGVKPNIRFKLWKIAILTWKRNMLFGYGSFPAVHYTEGRSKEVDILTHAHNVFLQILVTNGLIGLLAFLNLFCAFVFKLFSDIKVNRYAICLIAVIFAFFIEGIFEYFWGDAEVRYLFLYFIGFVMSSVEKFKQ